MSVYQSEHDAIADKLLAENPSSEYPFYSSYGLYRVSKHEVCIDPNDISRANEVIPKDQRVDAFAERERRRRRNVKAVSRRVGPKLQKAKTKAVA